MTVSVATFDIEEITNPTTIRAIVEVGRSTTPAFGPPQRAGSYGIALRGLGEFEYLYGAGYGPSDEILRAYAVRHILERYQEKAERIIIEAKGLEQPLRNVAGSLGQTKGGGPFIGFDVLKPVQEALGRGQWELVPFKSRFEPVGHHKATEMAEIGLEVALILQAVFPQYAPDHPVHHIIASSENPDPDGVVSALRRHRA